MCRLLGGPTYSLHLHGDLAVYGRDHLAKMRSATFVAAAARPMQQQVIELGIPAERTHTLWMGVDTTRVRPPQIARKLGDPLHLVSVSRLDLCKGHIHAFAALRMAIDRGLKARYSVAGSGSDEAEIRAAIDRYGLTELVQLLGLLGEDGVRDLLHSADAFVLSSTGLGEASPVAVMEAMACGVPVVSSIIGGTPDMIVPGESGLLVQQGDEAGLAEAFLRLAAEPAERTRLGRAARAGRAVV